MHVRFKIRKDDQSGLIWFCLFAKCESKKHRQTYLTNEACIQQPLPWNMKISVFLTTYLPSPLHTAHAFLQSAHIQKSQTKFNNQFSYTITNT